jgi:4a-hydroxytetrahydrobiopterin dehydratase
MTVAMTDAEINERLQDLPGWTREGGAIQKVYELDSYTAGIVLAAAVGAVCEGLNHHPDMMIGYKKVTVKLSTHDIGHAISPRDFETAEAIERLGYPKRRA